MFCASNQRWRRSKLEGNASPRRNFPHIFIKNLQEDSSCPHLFCLTVSCIALSFLFFFFPRLITAYQIFPVCGERMSLLLCYCIHHKTQSFHTNWIIERLCIHSICFSQIYERKWAQIFGSLLGWFIASHYHISFDISRIFFLLLLQTPGYKHTILWAWVPITWKHSVCSENGVFAFCVCESSIPLPVCLQLSPHLSSFIFLTLAHFSFFFPISGGGFALTEAFYAKHCFWRSEEERRASRSGRECKRKNRKQCIQGGGSGSTINGMRSTCP